MTEPDFYITSSEGHMPTVHKCFRLKRLRLMKRNDLLLIRIEPPLFGRQYNFPVEELDKIVIASRHNGTTLFPITKWPTYVYVLAIQKDELETLDELRESDYKLIAWAEIYQTELEAISRSHKYP